MAKFPMCHCNKCKSISIFPICPYCGNKGRYIGDYQNVKQARDDFNKVKSSQEDYNMESTKYILDETVKTKDGLTGIIDGIDNSGSPLYEPCYYVKFANEKTSVYSESQLKEMTHDK